MGMQGKDYNAQWLNLVQRRCSADVWSEWVVTVRFLDYLVLCLRFNSASTLNTQSRQCTLRRYKGAYPTPLEAVLRAEIAFFANFQATWTLQSPSIILALLAYTLLRDGTHLHTGYRIGSGLSFRVRTDSRSR